MALAAAGFSNMLEPPGLSRQDGKRPDGLTCYPWSNGNSLIWDVTVVVIVAPSYINLTSKKCGAAADKAERNKQNHYTDLKQRYNFTLNLLLQRISIAIQRGNAASIRNTFCDNSGSNFFL